MAIRNILASVWACAVLTLTMFAFAEDRAPITAFAEQSTVRSMRLSPNGKTLAYVQRIEGVDYVMVRDVGGGAPRAITRSDHETHFLEFLGDNYLLLFNYETRGFSSEPGVFRVGAALVYNFAKGDTYRLHAPGRILGLSDDGERLYAVLIGPAEVRLSSGNVWRPNIGSHWGEDDWLVSSDGVLLAAEEFDTAKGEYRLSALDGSKRRVLVERENDTVGRTLAGRSADGRDAIISESWGDGERVLRRLSLASGAMGEPLFSVPRADAGLPVVDEQRIVHGALVTGVYPSYRFLDPELTVEMNRVRASFPGQSVWVQDWARDWSRLLLYAEGGREPGRWVLYDRAAGKLTPLMSARPGLNAGNTGETIAIEYKAADGTSIPAVLTWPAGLPADRRRNLPMVVLPHGGPEAYSAVTFNPLVQFLASQGYAVLQPNYRGSGGFGADFRKAGQRQYAGLSISDITAGVDELVAAGWVDGRRVCIAGSAFGGYMALTSAALAPDRYRCAISLGGVSDLPDYMDFVRDGTNAYSVVLRRWRDLLGDPVGEASLLAARSPVAMADRIKAPVLLVHGLEDLGSPDRQSARMERAIKEAGGTATYVRIEEDGGEFLRPGNYARVLTELAGFLDMHIGEAAATASGR